VPNDIKAKQATFGTNIKYAKFHQHGTSEMPSRPVVFIPDGSSLFFAERIAQHLDPSPALSPLKAMIYR
jgi:phage gpG-like protein